MATMTYTTADVWCKCKANGGTDTQTASIPVTGLPEGATIQKVTLNFYVSHTYSSPYINRVSVGETKVWEDYQPGSGNKSVDVTGLLTGAALPLTFYAQNGSSNTKLSNTAYTGISLVVEYIVPKSSFTLDKASLEAGGSLTVNIARLSSGYTHKVTVKLGTRTLEQTGVATQAVFTLPLSWCDQITGATQAQGTVTVETFGGGGSLGANTASFVLTVPASVVPAIGSLTATLLDGAWGLYVQGHSRCRLTAGGVAGAYGSTVTSVVISGDGGSARGVTWDTHVLRTAGNVTFTATVTDSRGRTAQKTVTIAVTPYAPVAITGRVAARCQADGTEDRSGTSIKAGVSYTMTAIGDNAATVKVHWRTGGGAWTEIPDWPSASGVTQIILPGSAALDSAYEVRLTVQDGLTTAEQIGAVSVAEAFMTWSKKHKAFGFGCYPEGEKRIQVAEDWKLILGQTDVQTALIQRDRVRNLLDNSDFRNPVNQRGASSYTGNVYTIDRWALWWDDTTNGTLTINDDGITVTKWLFQNLENVDPDKEYTFAVSTANGLHVVSGKPSESATDGVISLIVNGYVQVNVNNPGKMYWAALYEGSYTADTLPTYVPKGYGAELAECRRYYRRNEFLNCAKTNGNYFSVSKSIEMRAVPTVTLLTFAPYGLPTITDMSGCAVTIAQSAAGVQRITYATLPTCSAYSAGGLSAHLSADL